MAERSPVVPRRRAEGLKPLRAAQRSPQATDLEIETRLREAWTLVVGSALAKHTRLIRVRRGVLVVGAWDLAHIQALRQAAAAAWPEVRTRLKLFTGIELAGLAVEPCDVPPTEREAGGDERSDPLATLISVLKNRGAGR